VLFEVKEKHNMAAREFYFVRVAKAFVDKQGISRKRIAIFFAIIAILLFFVFVLAGPYGVINMANIHSEKKELTRKIDSLENEKKMLNEEIKRLKTDKREIERIAREKYGMAKPNEKVYKIVPADTAKREAEKAPNR
jgi:cell division protein FtsB